MPVLTIALALSLAPQFAPDAVLLRTPDVSETHIVFQYSGDLWTAAREGGVAARLTSAAGTESLPKFSPDGQTVAFVGDYDGGTDLFTIPLAGGPPRRITFHPGRETLANWHPSGDSLLYFGSEASGVARAPKIFRVPATGGNPEALPVPYGTFCAIDPTGQWLAYTPLTREGRTWRRYRGGMAQDIWLYHLETGESRRVTDDPGTDRMPMWAGDQLIFQSDRGDKGIANLYGFDLASGETERLTSFASSGARFPSVGPKDIVFEQGGSLFRYLLDSREIERVRITIPGDRPSLRPVMRDLAKAASGGSLSKSGKRVALEARGEIFSVPVEEGITRNLTASDGVAEREPSLSPDGRWVAYWSDRTGEYELTLRHADGSALSGQSGTDLTLERTLTATGKGWKSKPQWAPDSTRIAWSNQNGELFLSDLEAEPASNSKPITTGYAPDYLACSWSPDSRWITWSNKSSVTKLEAIYLYDVEGQVQHEVTSGLFNDREPVFSSCGEWLFFHSSRFFSPTYADLEGSWIYRDSTQLMAVPLNGDVELPWALANEEEEFASAGPEEEPSGEPEGELKGAPESGEAESESDEDENGDGPTPPGPITVETEGFEARIAALPIAPGIAGGLVGHDGAVLFARVDDGSASVYLFKLEEHGKGEQLVIKGVSGYELSSDGKKLLVETEAGMGVVDAAPGQSMEGPLDLGGVRGRFDPREEWPQMIFDVYRLYRDWFYDEGLHGVDWAGERDKALDRLKDATSRSDVHFLIGEMLAELNVGHAYNQPPTGAADLDGFARTANLLPTGLLGADFAAQPDAGARAGFRVERVLGSAAETDGRGPLHGKAKAGDVLVAINGARVDASRSLHGHLVGTAGKTVELTFLRAPKGSPKGSPEGSSAESAEEPEEESVLVKPLRSETELRYRDWVAGKRAAVHAASGGQIGYIHVPSTGIDGQNELYRQFMSQHHHKALIVDERWNSGGQIPTRFIELLARKPTNAWATRGGKVFEWPEVYHDGPKAMLINHSAGSGGDAFPWYFKKLGLGPLIGTRTWGGLVGMSGNPSLIDGAEPTVPTFGFFELDSTWGVEGYGVPPDIEVVDDPGLMTAGDDPQLDRAIAELKTSMETWPYADWTRPAGPSRAGAGVTESDR